MTDIKFYFFPYDGRIVEVYSKKTANKFLSDDISNIVWKDEFTTIPGFRLTIQEIIENFPAQDGLKKHRPIIMLFDVDHYPVLEQVGYDKWNGCIRLDIDLDEKHTGLILSQEDIDGIYNTVKVILKQKFAHNWLYIEHSSSGKGIHIIFYYDVEKKTESFFKGIADYTKEHFIDAVKQYSPRLHNLLLLPGVFDPIYRKLYQKTYITTKDYEINENCTGFILEDIIENYIEAANKALIQNELRKQEYKPGQYEIIYSSDTQFDKIIHHDTRFKIATALKAATNSKEEWLNEHRKICQRYRLYDDYTTLKFINAFNYESLDATTMDPGYLKNFGITIDKTKWKKTLKSNEFLGDVLPEILSQVEPGCNLLISPTGSGKTVSWINYHKEIFAKNFEYENLFSFNEEKPILIIEPLNSIIDTKYDPAECKIITGNKKFPQIITQYGLYITNYNKLLEKKGDRYYPRKDLHKLINQFRFIVVDESHIVIKDSFRSDVLQAFTNAINSITEIPIILQTATPMDEDRLFTIKKQFIVSKPSTKNIKYIFRTIDVDKFEFSALQCLINYYCDTGRKTYIYWTDGSYQRMKIIYKLFGDKAAIFHKRAESTENDKAKENMEYIKTEHALNDKYDILLSSVYFGVGNDLNDTGKTAVIIVGNNTWQEDIQAIGRWRNSEDIEVCQIILPREKEVILEDYGKGLPDYEESYNNRKWFFNNILIDRYNKDKSVIIKNKEYKLTDAENLHTYTVMAASEIYHSNINLKIKMLREYGIDVREYFDRPLLMNEDYLDITLEHAEEIKCIRNKIKQEIIEGKRDYDDSDPRIAKFARIWRTSVKLGIDKILGAKFIAASSNWDKLKMFIDYYYSLDKQKAEFSELYSLILVREKIFELTKEEQTEMLTVKGEEDFEITRQDYFIAIGYAIFCLYKNKDKQWDSKVFNNYFKTYMKYAKFWLDFPDKLIDYMFKSTHKVSEWNEYKTDLGNIFTLGDLNPSNEITGNEDLRNLITENLGVDIQYYLEKCFKTLKAGRPENGEHKAYKTRRDKGKKRKTYKKREGSKVVIDGKEYKDAKTAAKKLGVSVKHIYKIRDKN